VIFGSEFNSGNSIMGTHKNDNDLGMSKIIGRINKTIPQVKDWICPACNEANATFAEIEHGKPLTMKCEYCKAVSELVFMCGAFRAVMPNTTKN
jgi:hypothetical protein